MSLKGRQVEEHKQATREKLVEGAESMFSFLNAEKCPLAAAGPSSYWIIVSSTLSPSVLLGCLEKTKQTKNGQGSLISTKKQRNLGVELFFGFCSIVYLQKQEPFFFVFFVSFYFDPEVTLVPTRLYS